MIRLVRKLAGVAVCAGRLLEASAVAFAHSSRLGGLSLLSAVAPCTAG
jgi:hypothetical protein